MDIVIDINSARAANEKLPAIISQVGGVKDTIAKLRSTIDPRVLDRSDLLARLSNAQKLSDSIERNMLLLHRTTAQNINGYEENELRAKKRVNNIPEKPR